uniref:Uncharacterized protein n=1 Tax=Anguilla anguilla TaxID=7936 RepID=A0A0E9WBE4_ANGAN
MPLPKTYSALPFNVSKTSISGDHVLNHNVTSDQYFFFTVHSWFGCSATRFETY